MLFSGVAGSNGKVSVGGWVARWLGGWCHALAWAKY